MNYFFQNCYFIFGEKNKFFFEKFFDPDFDPKSGNEPFELRSGGILAEVWRNAGHFLVEFCVVEREAECGGSILLGILPSPCKMNFFLKRLSEIRQYKQGVWKIVCMDIR